MTSHINEAQATGLQHSVGAYERARGLRQWWAGFKTLGPSQGSALVEQANAPACRAGCSMISAAPLFAT